jgi:hypothetical protein
MDSVMSKTPPTAKKVIGSGALVVTIAIIPPSKATTPTTAILDRLTSWLRASCRHKTRAVVLVGTASALFCGY